MSCDKTDFAGLFRAAFKYRCPSVEILILELCRYVDISA